MRNESLRARQATDREEPDEWLIDAARRGGHKLPHGARPSGTSAWRVLLSAGIPDAEVLRLACAASGTEAADFSRLSPALGSLLAHSVALRHRVVPVGEHNGVLGVATSNPRSPALERELAFAAKQRVRLHAASPGDIIRAQGVVYATVYGTKSDGGAAVAPAVAPLAPPPSVTQPRAAPVARLSLGVPIPPEAQDAPAPPPRPASPGVAPAAAPDPTDRLLAAAFTDGASEAILEPIPDGGLLLRLRIDGTLNDRFRIAEAHATRAIQMLKARAHVNVAETRRPQQGRTTFASPNGPAVVRISTEPLRDGRERVVLRLFAAQALLGLTELGYCSTEQHRFRQLLGSAVGLVVVAGPAGAGKTTTLYAAARETWQQGRVVSTVEEPIEFPLEQITQLQVSGSPYPALASAVRASFAAAGDVVVVGAPLDAPTLELCAAGGRPARLVIASLATSDVPSTLSRLQELHADRAALAAALQGVVVQRLVRRLCTACAQPQQVSELPELQQSLLYGRPAAKVRRPVGCAKCRTTGYLGRMAIAEVVPVTAPLREAIARGATSAELARVARENGMTTLWDSGMSRVLEGATSLAELLDAVQPPESGSGAPQEDIDALLTQLLGSPHMQPEAAPSAAPAARVATKSAPAVPAARRVPAAPAVPVTRAAPAPVAAALRVLVVDDDAAARRTLAHALTQAGIQVLEAADGVAALAYVKRLRPDAVLTELALPKLDAIGLLAALAEEESAPVVVVRTAQRDDALDSWLRESGAGAVLSRGLPAVELVARLKELARGA